METNESFNEVPITIPIATEGPGEIEDWNTEEVYMKQLHSIFGKRKMETLQILSKLSDFLNK